MCENSLRFNVVFFMPPARDTLDKIINKLTYEKLMEDICHTFIRIDDIHIKDPYKVHVYGVQNIDVIREYEKQEEIKESTNKLQDIKDKHGINFIKGFIETMEKNNGNR